MPTNISFTPLTAAVIPITGSQPQNAFVFATLYTPARAAPASIVPGKASFRFVDKYVAPQAAEASIRPGQPTFQFAYRYFAPSAAEIQVIAGEPSFSFRKQYRAPQAAEVLVTAGQPSFSFPYQFNADAALAVITPGQPSFITRQGALRFDADPALATIEAVQPTFTFKKPTPLSWTAPAAAQAIITPGQPSFIGGDLLKKAPAVFPFLWDDAEPLVERYGYAASVFKSDDASEQRRRQRSLPSGSIRFTVNLLDARSAQQAHALLYGRQPKPLIVPIWQYGCSLTSPLALGSNTATADFSSVPLFEGQWIVIWASPTDYELNVIADFDAGHVNFLFPSKKARGIGQARIVPAAEGRLTAQETLSWIDLMVARASHEFTIERWHA